MKVFGICRFITDEERQHHFKSNESGREATSMKPSD